MGPFLSVTINNTMDTLSTYVNKAEETIRSNDFDSWVVSLGKAFKVTPNLREEKRCGCGCDMHVWVRGFKGSDGTWIFEGDSDTLFNRGLTKIVLDSFTGLSSTQALGYNFHNFKPIARGINFHQRRGVQCIINQIHKIVNA